MISGFFFGLAAGVILGHFFGDRDGFSRAINLMIEKGWYNIDGTKKQVTNFLKGQAK